MPKLRLFSLAITSVILSSSLHAVGFANNVVSYTPGTGVPTGYTTATSALGEPSRVTPGQFGGPVDPFSPPYLAEQVVSIGAGGSLTLQFEKPILNDPANAYGIDFIVFGNSGFQIVNGDFTGGGVTDGSLFGANAGTTRVSVSADGQTFYELTPSLAPVIDGPFPTDGSGDFFQPVDPSLTTSAFAGKGLGGIRQIYKGSAGGAAYDLSWARRSTGEPANLTLANYLRFEVISGVSEIDGVSVIPEPSASALFALGGLGLWLFKRRARAC